ncbi:MAG: FkbM family methyltransferase [Coleofasciculus sp. A1-SPW-01]|uniref:FkbM family methyltransferase n=1 Tax=Coleofasciculus sp. A1-SPW-01 TaxID=3070819 RepID=UPI0032FD1806
MKRQIREILKNLGYEIHNTKTKYLPPGMDLVADIKKIFPDLSQINTVFDVGANIGQTALYFSQKLPDANILSFEPVKETFHELQNNTSRLKQVNCFNHAFGDKDESKRIFMRKDSQIHSMIDNVTSPSDAISGMYDIVGEEIVNIKKIDSFCYEQNIDTIDLLKIDTEGYEMQVLQGASSYLGDNRVKLIYSEVGWDKDNKALTFFPDIYLYLSKQKFKLYGLYGLRHNYKDGSFGLFCCNALFVNSNAIKAHIEPKWWS